MAVGVFIPKGDGQRGADFREVFAARLEKLHAHILALEPGWSWCKLSKATGDTIQHMWEYRHAKRFVGPRFLFDVLRLAHRYDAVDIILGDDGCDESAPPEDGRKEESGLPSVYASLLARSPSREELLRRPRRRTTTRH